MPLADDLARRKHQRASRPNFPRSPLNDRDRRTFIIQAVRHRLTDEPHGLLALGIALGLDHVVGIVKQDAVAALAGGHAADCSRYRRR
jgi:hypothetical protein